jgi:hypothetical protein
MIGALAVCGATILTMTLLGALVTLAPRVLFSSFRPVTNLPNSGQNTACCDTRQGRRRRDEPSERMRWDLRGKPQPSVAGSCVVDDAAPRHEEYSQMKSGLATITIEDDGHSEHVAYELADQTGLLFGARELLVRAKQAKVVRIALLTSRLEHAIRIENLDESCAHFSILQNTKRP